MDTPPPVAPALPKKSVTTRSPSVKQALPQSTPQLPEYLRIKLTKKSIATLPVNQQTVANHVMILRKDPQNSRSLRFLCYWQKRLQNSIEKDELGKIILTSQNHGPK